MTSRSIARLFAIYFAVLLIACIGVYEHARLRPSSRGAIASLWSHGQLIAREAIASPDSSTPLAARDDGELVIETITHESAIVTSPAIVFAMSLAPGHDGVAISIDGKTAYVTPDDLLARQGYDRFLADPSLGLSIGADVPLILALASDRLGVSVSDIESRAAFRRIRVQRKRPRTIDPAYAHADATSITRAEIESAAIDAARYLARGVSPEGRFRFLVDAPTGRVIPGYDWPRHSGATYFLALAAARTHDPDLASACLRSAALLRDSAIASCGDYKCVGTDDVVDIGSAALAVIAFAEIARTHLDDSYAPLVRDLARFLRSQQRADGDFMHEYDRPNRRAVDVQYLYFTGEATLALSRAHALFGDADDLSAASRGLARLVGSAWSFFGDRYYFGEEHWTCQAMSDLWSRAPNATALDFCERWEAYGRAMQFKEGETPYDADGAFGVGPLVTPRLTPVASRSEAGAATLDTMIRANANPAEIKLVDEQLRRSLALLVRHQLRPGASHLFADPDLVFGGMPGSEVDWQLRVDFAQHAGCAMLRWLDVTAR